MLINCKVQTSSCLSSCLANIVRNKVTNKSKGFGYVTFETEEDAEKALVNMNGKVRMH